MNASFFGALAARVLIVLGLGATAIADVIVVDANGGGQYTSIQTAIAAAQDGDILIVHTGTYPAFTVDNRDLWIVSGNGAVVNVNGTVRVRNLAASKACLLSGLQLTGVNTSTYDGTPALKIESNAGNLRIEKCTMRGSDAYPYDDNLTGGVGTVVTGSLRVALSNCSSTGGKGSSWTYLINGGRGGDAITTQGSIVALYDSILTGGDGGIANYVIPGDSGGDGGDGCRVYDYGILASGSQIRGGRGGNEWTVPGDGGNGLYVGAGQAQLVDCILAGGLGGSGGHSNGAPGASQSGPGVVNVIAGAARKLTTNATASASGSLQLDLAGEPGDQYWLFQTGLGDFVYSPARAGVLLVKLPALSGNLPHVTLPASGTASVIVPMPGVATGLGGLRRHWQGVVITAGGQVRLSSPAHVVVLE